MPAYVPLDVDAEPFDLRSALAWARRCEHGEAELRAVVLLLGLQAADPAPAPDFTAAVRRARRAGDRDALAGVLADWTARRERDADWLRGYLAGSVDAARSLLVRSRMTGPGAGRSQRYLAGWAAGVRDLRRRRVVGTVVEVGVVRAGARL